MKTEDNLISLRFEAFHAKYLPIITVSVATANKTSWPEDRPKKMAVKPETGPDQEGIL